LVNLELWQRIFLDGEDMDAVMRPVVGDGDSRSRGGRALVA
jgi:hypothetical protein